MPVIPIPTSLLKDEFLCRSGCFRRQQGKSARIAQLNDQFRKGIGLLNNEVPGQVFVTAGVNALPPEKVQEIIGLVRAYDDFSEDNDPYGEHDFGVLSLPDLEKIYWKFDYYDQALQYGSEDPSDPNVTQRVLTILFASEY